MSAAAAPNPAARHWVTCETSDQQQITVKMEVLRLSHTFGDMCKNLGLEEGDEFPGTFPVKNIEARVFYDVVDWCKKRKGKPDPVVEKDPFTQESKRFKLTKYEQWFLDLPVPELLELVMAANYLDIKSLYEYGCQAIADLIKGKETLEARHILQQQFDLTRSEVRCTRAQCPWLDTKADVLGEPGDVANPIHIPTEVLTTIFEKLTRVDLERLQLVSHQFRNIIQHNEELPLRPLQEVRFTTKANYWREQHGMLVLGVGEAKRLKCCAVRKLVFRDPITSPHCARLIGVKSAWKHAVVSASLDRFDSPETLTLALTDLLFCRKLRVNEYPACSPHSFLHLPVVISCNYLNIREKWLKYRSGETSWPPLDPADVLEWLEHEPEKEWDEPRRMDLDEAQLSGGFVGAVDVLKKAFFSATSRKPYVLSTRTYHNVQVNEVLSNSLGEHLRIRFEEDFYRRNGGDVIVERK